MASGQATNADRRERLRRLAMETIDLDKDPYFFKNHVGSYECRLCLTVHQNDGSYLAHTQGRKHQTNLSRRAAREAKEGRDREAALNPSIPGFGSGPGGSAANAAALGVRRNVVKIGRPGYKITKIRDPVSRAVGLLFQLQYPEISTTSVSLPSAPNGAGHGAAAGADGAAGSIVPRVRFMGAYEQKIETPDKAYQYLLVAAEPYETCAFKLQAREIDRRDGRFWTWFDQDSKEFWIQLLFKTEREERYSGVPGLAPLSRR